LTEVTLTANEDVESPTSPLPTILQPTSSQPTTLPTNPQPTSAEAANPTQEEESEDEELDPNVLAGEYQRHTQIMRRCNKSSRLRKLELSLLVRGKTHVSKDKIDTFAQKRLAKVH